MVKTTWRKGQAMAYKTLNRKLNTNHTKNWGWTHGWL